MAEAEATKTELETGGATAAATAEKAQGLDSIDKKCNSLKHAYDSCFNSWFNDEFLKGKSKDHSPCESMLTAYADCVKEAMIARGLDPVGYARHWEIKAKAEMEANEKAKKQSSNLNAGQGDNKP